MEEHIKLRLWWLILLIWTIIGFFIGNVFIILYGSFAFLFITISGILGFPMEAYGEDVRFWK